MNFVIAVSAPIPAVFIAYWLTRRKVREVHTLVNSQHDEILAINAALTAENIVLKKDNDVPPST